MSVLINPRAHLCKKTLEEDVEVFVPVTKGQHLRRSKSCFVWSVPLKGKPSVNLVALRCSSSIHMVMVRGLQT